MDPSMYAAASGYGASALGQQQQQQQQQQMAMQQSMGAAGMSGFPQMAQMGQMQSMPGSMTGAAQGGMPSIQQGQGQGAATGMDPAMGGMASSFGAGAAGGMPGVPNMMPAALNQMAAMAGLTPAAMQAMYQQYALRWAAMQRFAAQGMGGMAGMGTMGNMGGMGPMTNMAAQSGYGMMAGAVGGAASTGTDGKNLFWKTRICNKWKEGACTNAESCRYAHGESDLRVAGAAAAAAPAMMASNPYGAQAAGAAGNRTTIEVMKKTRLCGEFMQTGACKYGTKCTFAHGQHELRQPPPGPNGQPGGQRTNIHKTKLCQRFMQTGQCQYGTRCTFAHGHEELRAGQSAAGMGDGSGYAAAAYKPMQQQTCMHVGGHMAGQQQQQQLNQQDSSAGYAVQDSHDAYGGGMGSGHEGEEGMAGGATASGGAEGAAAGQKRVRAEGEEDQQTKRQHQEPEEEIPEPDCHYCAQLVKTGRKKVVDTIMGLENPQAKRLGCMIMAASTRIDQLWSKCTPAMLLGWLSKLQVNVMDKIDVLKTVVYHVHDDSSRPHPDSIAKYQEMGLPRDLADFVDMVMEGKEGSASMSEYFQMLEVAKLLFGVNDDNYFAVSTAVASIMTGV